MARPTPSIQLKDKDIQLPAPPHNSCEKTRDELKFLQNLTSNVTPEQTKLIKLADDNMITDIFMVDYDWPDKEQIVAQLEDLNKQINTITMKQKYKFNRPRPEQLAKEYGYNIKVFPSSTTKTPAYPSGHTTLAYVIAYISSDMNPSNRDKDFYTQQPPSEPELYIQKERVIQYCEELFIRQFKDEIIEADDGIAYYCSKIKDDEKIVLDANS